MLPLLTILILILVPLAMLVVRLLRPRFAYFWLIAAFGALIAWPVILMAHLELPMTIPLVIWQPQELFPVSPALLLDDISWPYALSLVTLALSVILTDVARASEADWLAWASSLLFTALGLMAVMAGNPLTLLLAWTAIDLVELLILLSQVMQSRTRERIVIAFSARVAGILMLIWAGMAARSAGLGLTFHAISPQVSIYLLLAAGLRLGVLPLHLPFLEELSLRRGLGTLLRLVPAAASLVLLARTATAQMPGNLSHYLLALTALAALYAGVSWASARNELDGRPLWIMGGAALSVAAAIRALPAASLAWGIATLLSGGLLFLTSARHRRLLPLVFLGMVGFSSLPYTPAWQGVRLFTPLLNPISLVLLVALAMLLAGYLRHALQPGPSLSGVERWVWVIYPWGLLLLFLAQGIIAWWSQDLEGFPALTASWPSLAVLAIVGLFIAANRRGLRAPFRILGTSRMIFSFNWLYRLVWRTYRWFGRLISLINLILEGEGGILWTLLLLTLLISLLAQQGLGG